MVNRNYKHKPKYKIVVSGAAETDFCASGALKKAESFGREAAKAGVVVVTGATSGVPFWAAKGAKEAGGFVVGLSPAVSEKSHIKTFRLPVDFHDIIIYTGFHYTGRNLLLTRAADAVVVICGRLGTLNEFTTAFEDNKPIGILEGTGGTADDIRQIVERSHRGPGKIIYSKDPAELLEKIIKLIDKEKKMNGK